MRTSRLRGCRRWRGGCQGMAPRRWLGDVDESLSLNSNHLWPTVTSTPHPATDPRWAADLLRSMAAAAVRSPSATGARSARTPSRTRGSWPSPATSATARLGPGDRVALVVESTRRRRRGLPGRQPVSEPPRCRSTTGCSRGRDRRDPRRGLAARRPAHRAHGERLDELLAGAGLEVVSIGERSARPSTWTGWTSYPAPVCRTSRSTRGRRRSSASPAGPPVAPRESSTPTATSAGSSAHADPRPTSGWGSRCAMTGHPGLRGRHLGRRAAPPLRRRRPSPGWPACLPTSGSTGWSASAAPSPTARRPLFGAFTDAVAATSRGARPACPRCCTPARLRPARRPPRWST